MYVDFLYQTKYESTIDTLTLRDNVKKILQNASFKSNAAFDTYQSSSVVETLNNTSIKIDMENELNETLNFLKSEAALKLLRLTEKHFAITNEVEILDFKIDESKKNIFAA